MKMITPKLLVATLALAGFAANAQTPVYTAQGFQNALTAAATSGGANTIVLYDSQNGGYYSGNFNYNSAANYNLTIQAASDDITIDGGGVGRGLTITSSGSGSGPGQSGAVTVSGITFLRNCGSDTIGALRIAAASGGTINVSQCNFLSPATGEGMGLEIASGGNADIIGCYFIGKTNGTSANYDGDGISIAGVTENTLIQGCTLSGNYVGWGAYITASAVLTVADNVFQTNYYGGLSFDPSGTELAQVFVTNNVFYGNKEDEGADIVNFNTLNISNNFFSGNPGGGLEVETGVMVTNTGNTFIGNGAGGLYFEGIKMAISTGNTFSGNYQSYGGGGEFQSVTTNILVGNTFSGNSSYYDGGGAYFSSCPYLTVSNNTFSANQVDAGSGGAVYITGSGVALATVIGNNFTANFCSGNYSGGALYITGVTNLITQNTFQRNSSADGGGAIYDTAPVITMTDDHKEM